MTIVERAADAIPEEPVPAPPLGTIGYTGSYSAPALEVPTVSVVAALQARGPD